MPTNVVILARLERDISESELQQLRMRLLSELFFEADDFYIEGPLLRVTQREFEFVPEADRDAVWLSLNLWRKYYGPGYERGNIQKFVEVAEWLNQVLLGCELYYGNDATPEDLQPFDRDRRTSLLE